MFIRVKSRDSGHEFDIHEHQFDIAKHTKVRRYPPSTKVRKTKFRVRYPRAFFLSPRRVEGGVGDVSDDS